MSTEQLYNDRLKRYVTAMRNGKPDKVPIRPFAAEFTAVHAGYTCQEVTHDYNKAFEAIIKCCTDYDWDATVANMVWVWTGLTVPIGFWMHRGGVPFVTPGQFTSHYWATLKPIIEEIWANGHQTLFYAEGDWGYHLDSFAELPAGSIVYHVDRGDVFETHRKLGDRFCLSGGIPNVLLSYGSPDEIRACIKKVIDEVARDGGYIMDASAIMQNDTKVENMRLMTDFTREYGVYSSGSSAPAAPAPAPDEPLRSPIPEATATPGTCLSWEKRAAELPKITGDAQIVQNQWEATDALANAYIWQCLLSF